MGNRARISANYKHAHAHANSQTDTDTDTQTHRHTDTDTSTSPREEDGGVDSDVSCRRIYPHVGDSARSMSIHILCLRNLINIQSTTKASALSHIPWGDGKGDGAGPVACKQWHLLGIERDAYSAARACASSAKCMPFQKADIVCQHARVRNSEAGRQSLQARKCQA